jgi:selenocysteine lyase/cysteine desulfurase
MLGIHALAASLSLFEELGMAAVAAGIERHVARLHAALATRDDCQLLSPATSERRAGIVTFRPRNGRDEALYRALQAAELVCARRGGGIRLSPHFWHGDADIDRALERIDTALAELDR